MLGSLMFYITHANPVANERKFCLGSNLKKHNEKKHEEHNSKNTFEHYSPQLLIRVTLNLFMCFLLEVNVLDNAVTKLEIRKFMQAEIEGNLSKRSLKRKMTSRQYYLLTEKGVAIILSCDPKVLIQQSTKKK